MTRPLILAPSILAADYANLAAELAAMDAAGADWFHLDVMDGHFVPPITFGPAVIAALRKHTKTFFDVHLMVSPPDGVLADTAAAGANSITVHVEAGPHIHRTLQSIRSLGCRAGIAVSPGTSVASVAPVLDLVDLILVMTVNPGFGGQAFLPTSLPRIAEAKAMAEGREIDIEVDGGIGPGNARACIEAGATVLVAGTSAFKGGAAFYAANLAAIRAA